MNLEVVKFLMEHGADKYLKCKTGTVLNSVELANNHCASTTVKKLLSETS